LIEHLEDESLKQHKMGNYQTTRANSMQTITNEFLNTQNTQCIAWGEASVDDSTIIVNRSRVRNIEIVATGTADLGCTINQQITTTVTSQLAAQAKQESDTDSGAFQLFTNSTRSISNQSQSLYNNVTNISNSTCGAYQSSSVDNGLIIANEVRGGRIAISANSSASSTCTLSNMIALEAYNQGTTTVDQTIKIEAGFGGLLVIIVAIIILIAVIVVIAGIAKKMFTPQPPQPVAPPPGSLEAELAAL
jgi:hypothetical protein